MTKHMEQISLGTTYAASGATALFWGLSISEWAVAGSFLVAVMAFGVNTYFKWRRNWREEIEHRKRMEGQ